MLTYTFWDYYMEIKTRTTLTKFNYRHPKSAIERISLKRQNGGRKLVDI